MNTLYDLKPIAEVIEAKGWVQETLENDGGVCITGALKYCEPQPGDQYILRAALRHRKHAESWNDAKDTTKSVVLSWLRQAEPVTDAELTVVFGPQWESIITLIHRAAVLSSDEIKILEISNVDWIENEAWDANVDWTAIAARSSTSRVCAAVTWEATWEATRANLESATAAAAATAAGALAIRDFIGDRFTQAHYDLLTKPWRTVIGKVHPDDD